MTVLEVIQRSSDFLTKKGVESPRLQVELLLGEVLQLPRLKLYLDFERALTDDELNRLREMVQRRANREPLQHIIGSTSFCGLTLMVNRDVLIPRPETEVLAERAWQFVEQLHREELGILDIGTGSGCLAIILAVKFPNAEIHATDQSAAALAVARSNAERHNVLNRMKFHECDFIADVPREIKFDLIVSNPPYIATAAIEALEPEVRDHDPRAALDGGPDGLTFFRRLATEVAPRLAHPGKLLAEFADGQEDPVARTFAEQSWIVEEIVKDLAGKPRIIIARRPNS